MHIRELLTVERQVNRNKTRSRFVPATRNETIKMMTECPASTTNRIVFLPNMNGVGFRCKLRHGQSIPHDTLNQDEKAIERLPPAIKQQVIAGVRTINAQCYQTWREIKYERENFPLEKEKWLLNVSVLLSILCIGLFFTFHADIPVMLWNAANHLYRRNKIDLLVVVAALMVCCKRNSTDNLDIKVSESITLEMKKLNESSNFKLVWRNPKNQVWIYVTVPEELL